MADHFKPYLSPSESRYAPRIGNDEWERYRKKLTRLHRQNIPRKTILQIMKDEDGFQPSMPQLNARFNQWRLRRYEKASRQNTPAAREDLLGPHLSQPSTSPPESTMLVRFNSSHDVTQQLRRDIEGVGGGFEGIETSLPHNHDQAWLQLEASGTSSSDGSSALLTSRPTRSHQIVGASGFAGVPTTGRRVSDEDTSSSGAPDILTPGTTTPSQASTTSHGSTTATYIQTLESFEQSGDRGLQNQGQHAADTSQQAYMLYANRQRYRAMSPYARSPIPLPKDFKVSEDLLRCIQNFSRFMSNDQSNTNSFGLYMSSPTRARLRDNAQKLHIRRCINATAEAFEGAHYFLKLEDPAKAHQRLYDAATTIPPMFEAPDLFLLTRLVEIATWSSWKKFPGYEPIVFKYLTSEAGKRLGVLHPLTLLLDCFTQQASISIAYPTLWQCVIEHIDQITDASDSQARIEAQQIRIKAYFYLVRVLRNTGRYDDAILRCKELISLCVHTDGARSFSANRARYNLAVNYCEAGDIHAAMEAYGEARKWLGTRDCPDEGWVFSVFASSELAQLYEQEGDVAKAAELYEEALVPFLEIEGDSSSGALLMLKDLLDFYKRLGNREQLNRIYSQYPACCAVLESGALNDARRCVGRRVTTQASGGKKRRPWTWTSPIT
ncbi:hypothetical protein QBC47DRAFT_394768 [Echria macrotheca]|uniref:Clr5 domain-containing protein n=1 Tax=Echria macrotheca TaxID=438768 RepID=A0AAJ0F1N5_9PEZI|nr:hypothetical protein QBC47DRAFT_394768 [Echria macrotheca]